MFWQQMVNSINLGTVLGISVERIAYRPLRNAPRFAVIISVLGMSIFLQNMARIVWGAEFQTFDVDFGIPPIIFGNVVIPFKKVFILATSLILMIALGLYVKKTYIGKAMRATAADPEAAEMMGINLGYHSKSQSFHQRASPPPCCRTALVPTLRSARKDWIDRHQSRL
jgi:branched-chain amino acid transport system permease protein